MANPEPVLPFTRSSQLSYKVVSFTENSVGPTVSTVPSTGKQPELVVSPSVLTFAQRTADKPVFSIVTIVQQNADTPITLSTDEPDYFQLASDSRPAFGPTLTFTPPPSGAYVHVRYMAPKGCSHRAQLTIEAPYTNTTITLEARTTSALSVVQNVLPSTNRVPVKQPNRIASGSRWAALLATVVVSGLIYAGYTYQCQLFPSLCQEKTTGFVRPKTYSPLLQPTSDAFSRITETEERSNKVTKEKGKTLTTHTSPERTSAASIDNSFEKLPDNQLNKPRRITRNQASAAISDKVIEQENTATEVRSQARRRQDSTPTAKESELERELNKHF